MQMGKNGQNGARGGSPYGPPPAQPSTGVLPYTPKAKHKARVRRGAAGIPLNNIPPFGAPPDEGFAQDISRPHGRVRGQTGKRPRFCVGISTGLGALAAKMVGRTGIARSNKTKCGLQTPEMPTTLITLIITAQ